MEAEELDQLQRSVGGEDLLRPHADPGRQPFAQRTESGGGSVLQDLGAPGAQGRRHRIDHLVDRERFVGGHAAREVDGLATHGACMRSSPCVRGEEDRPETKSWVGHPGAAGSETRKVEPLPTSLSTVISPPRSPSSRRTMCSPRPTPPALCRGDPLTCRKGSKITRCPSASMPMPESTTSMIAPSSLLRTRTVTWPRSVNLRALVIRFFSTSLSFGASVTIVPTSGATSQE